MGHQVSNTERDDVAAIERLGAVRAAIEEEVGRRIVGQHETIEEILIAFFAGGHALLVGVPGLAKTLMVRSVATALSLQFSRIQFTPDLMPSDIIGTEVIQENRSTGERSYRFLPGPVFANIVLADEINRTPPKTQAALLEAMQEGQVTVGGTGHRLPDPFFVLATQNPIEQEGTYPLPEAQLDRFLFQILVDYPAAEEELDIILRTTSESEAEITAAVAPEEIPSLRSVVRRVPIADHVARYALALVRATRPDDDGSLEVVREFVAWGAGPRGGQFLVLAAKARAALAGRFAVEFDDIRSLVLPVLRHRIKLNFHADAEGVRVDDVVRQVFESVVPD